MANSEWRWRHSLLATRHSPLAQIPIFFAFSSSHHQVPGALTPNFGWRSGRENAFQYAAQNTSLYHIGTQYWPERNTRSSARPAAFSSARVFAYATASTSVSTAGSTMPAMLRDPFTVADDEENN